VLVTDAVSACTAILGHGMPTSAPDSHLCMESARVGTVIPRDLPYGGGVDITDQLHGLQ
jgi:hypothetical protein